ncbi:hypothetical protein AMS68_006601 [Peltaster fructicola]|uniref:Very long-chain fatty acid transport protein n=1 Tax=Peltaster fructicola TaxID=286661 RepID=A0A6H0Y249_9PEZI|nr:hypothetical protein AMS68_006601 [Peltaster fructicola]
MVVAEALALAAATAYANGKYHIGRDLKTLRLGISVARQLKKRSTSKRASLWYDFEDQIPQRPNDCAIWYREGPGKPAVEYTWQQTYDKSLQYAQFFLDQGVTPGQLVGTYLINAPEFMFDVLGCWAIGCAPAEINYNLAGDSLVHCLKVSGAKLLIIDEEAGCRERIEAVRSRIENDLGMRIIVLDDATKAKIDSYVVERPGDEFRKHINGDSPIVLFYTSGTTGHPKACGFKTERAYAIGIPIISAGALQAGDRWYDCMPLYHGTGLSTALGCMISGVTLCIGRRFSTSNFWQDIHDSQANAFVYVGETARYLLTAPPSPLDKDHDLKMVFGNGMRPDVWAKFQERFNVPQVNEFFNSTEGMLSLLNVCRGPFSQGYVGQHGALLRLLTKKQLVPVQIDYEDADKIWRDPVTGFGKRNSYEDGGEILVACADKAQFAGYHNNTEATNKRFEHDVFVKGDLYYRTGDALRRDSDGRWSFMDRLGDTFRWKSENVSTAEVAEVLGRYPGVLEANVFGSTVPSHEGRCGVAAIFVKPEERDSFNWKGLLAHARKRLPKYAVPVFIRIVKSPTPIHNNKQNKVPLRNEGIDLEKIANGVAGREDRLLWVQPNTDTYEPFSQSDLDQLVAGRARL